MQHIEGRFNSPRNASIYYQAWLPEGGVKAALLLVHGLGEHSGRYGNVVNRLVPLGYAVYGLDHAGHGKSEGAREYIDRFEDYIETLAAYRAMVAGWQAGRPLFLLGHSMGGLISTVYLLDRQAEFKGAVLSAPAIKVGGDIPPALVALSKILAAVAPRAGVAGLDTRLVSRDPAVVAAYDADPLIFHGKTTARLGAELLKAGRRAAVEARRISLPILILQGGGDRIVDPAGAQLLHNGISSSDKTLKQYEGLYHEVFNEPERDRVLQDVEAWLAARA
jgi:alpha-beta hydrolase superfamily lysophospholipase